MDARQAQKDINHIKVFPSVSGSVRVYCFQTVVLITIVCCSRPNVYGVHIVIGILIVQRTIYFAILVFSLKFK